MKLTKKQRRQGYTLVEALVVIALTAVTLTIVTVCMHTLHRAEHQLRDELQAQRLVERLGAQLRMDAHQAIAVTTKDGVENPRARVLTLTQSNNLSIEYSLGNNGVERTVKRGSDVEHREHFHFAPASGNFWIVDAARPYPFVALHLVQRRSIGDSKAEHDVTVVQAAVGISNQLVRKD